MPHISQNSMASAAWAAPGSSDAAEPLPHDLFGLLIVRQDGQVDELGNAQLEAALRMLNGTEVGGKLLRAVALCDIPAHERPAILFDHGNAHGESTFENGPPSGAALIRFDVVHSDELSDADGRDAADTLVDQSIDLFLELTAYYARITNQPCPQPYLGFGDYSTLTLREQLGDAVPQWQRDVEAYIRDTARPGENRAGVWTATNAWRQADDPEQPLCLNFMGLTICPPLRNLPGLKRLELVENRLDAFPPGDRLPPTTAIIDLAGNPIRKPADDHGPNLRSVTLDRAACEGTGLRASLPSHVQVIEVGPDYVLRMQRTTQFIAQFPMFKQGIVEVEAFEGKGWSNDVMASLYEQNMLESAAGKWLSSPNGAWRRAQEEDPNGAAALSALMGRLYTAWSHQKDPGFRQRFVALLSKMEQPGNGQFMHDCVNVARDGAASCDDLILHTVNSLHIASLNADARAGVYDNRIVELMHLGEDMLNLHTLTQFFADIRPELQRRARAEGKRFDEIEQFLHLQTLLQGKVHLPDMQFKMQWSKLSLVAQADAQAAQLRISAARNTDFMDFLASWSPLQSVIERTAPELAQRASKWRDQIYNYRGGVYDLLDRLLKADGRLFASRSQTERMDVFNIRPRMFWTRYERLVDQQLATRGMTRGMTRDMPEILPQVCDTVSKDIDLLIQTATTRAFLKTRRLTLQDGIQDAEPPRWFKQLRKDIP